jgi:hypothetical protein
VVLYSCVLIVFSLHRESLKLILDDEPLLEVVLSQRVGFLIVGCWGPPKYRAPSKNKVVYAAYFGEHTVKKIVRSEIITQTGSALP